LFPFYPSLLRTLSFSLACSFLASRHARGNKNRHAFAVAIRHRRMPMATLARRPGSARQVPRLRPPTAALLRCSLGAPAPLGKGSAAPRIAAASEPCGQREGTSVATRRHPHCAPHTRLAFVAATWERAPDTRRSAVEPGLAATSYRGSRGGGSRVSGRPRCPPGVHRQWQLGCNRCHLRLVSPCSSPP
jgi:hypothetical protein